MSENIASRFNKIKQGKCRGFYCVVDPEMSNQARHSEATKVSKVAEVSPPIPVSDTTRIVGKFSQVFDQLYIEFTEKMGLDY
jgi:hypothetical protein